jgi:hypothetical protein
VAPEEGQIITRRHRRHSTKFKLQVVKAYLDGSAGIRKMLDETRNPGGGTG